MELVIASLRAGTYMNSFSFRMHAERLSVSTLVVKKFLVRGLASGQRSFRGVLGVDLSE